MSRTQHTDPIQREITLADGVTKVMQGLANVQVSVFKINEDGSRGALATLYAARGPADITPFAGGNPFVTGAAGKTGFWADNGDYDLDFHDLNVPARIGDQTVGWSPTSGADRSLKVTQLPEYGRGLAPAGGIMSYAGTGDPPGWLLCDGRVLSQATYPALYAAIGLVYGLGNEGAGNFRLPDYRGRSIIGLDDMGTAAGAAGRLASLASGARARGQSGGADSVVLAANHLPAHSHRLSITSNYASISINAAGAHAHNSSADGPQFFYVNGGGGADAPFDFAAGYDTGGSGLDLRKATNTTTINGDHAHGVTDNGHGHLGTVDDTGQTRGAAHSNLHPYQISNVIIKT